MKTRILLSLSLLFSVQFIFAQLTVTPLNDQAAYDSAAQQLIGFGVTISNATVNCGTDGMGLYADDTTIGGNGVLLTTGTINGAIGPNDNSSESTSSDNTMGDVDLENIANGIGINDVCTFEFDVTVVGTVLDFDYVFASEEYPEFVCTQFNDTFGFFISGPNPDGGDYTSENIALVGGEVVSINTVNNGFGASCPGCPCNSALYVDNQSGSDVQYDGFTKLLLATVATVPGETYHLKMGLADLADSAFDTGVFISGGSFKSYGPSGIEAQMVDKLFYPNPSQGVLIFEEELDAYNDLLVYSKDGKLVWSKAALTGSNKVQLPEKLSNGLYFVELRSAQGRVVAKLNLLR